MQFKCLCRESGRWFAAAAFAATTVLGWATAAEANIIVENDTFGPLSGGTGINFPSSGFTTGGPFTFVTDTPSFLKFNPASGTLLSATLAWTITGTENGIGNFAGTGIFSYDAQSQTVTFDTVTDQGPKNFDFTGSDTLNLASVTGTGSVAPSTFNGTMSQSGFFPWSGTMTDVNGSVSVTYNFQTAGATTTVPEPGSLALLSAGLLGFGLLRRRKAG